MPLNLPGWKMMTRRSLIMKMKPQHPLPHRTMNPETPQQLPIPVHQPRLMVVRGSMRQASLLSDPRTHLRPPKWKQTKLKRNSPKKTEVLRRLQTKTANRICSIR